MVLNVENNMCALLIPAGNGNACAQMSQDRQRGEENCKIERLWGINLSTVQQRENFASFIRPKQRWQKFAYRLPWHWNLTSGKICHIEIYNERSIFQFNCFSHLNRCRLIIRKQNHLKLTSITAMFKRKFHHVGNQCSFRSRNGRRDPIIMIYARIFVFLARSKRQIVELSRDKLLKTKYYLGFVDLQRRLYWLAPHIR